MQNKKIQSFNFRRGLLASAVMAGMGVSSAQAIEVDVGNPDVAVRFDNTLKYNYGVRTESADQKMLNTPNNNDGDYNFRHAGTNITNRVDILSEVDVVYKESMGFRVSAAGWYDKAYDNTGSNSNGFVNGAASSTSQLLGGVNPAQQNPFINTYGATNPSSHLSNYAQRYYSGPSGEILDAFVFYSTEVGDESLLSFKVGQTNTFWGETLLNPIHSVSYGQSGLDLAKLASSPGTEAKELFVPRNQLFTSFTLNSDWTFAGQYFLDWDAARLPEAGTYYGGADVLDQGGQSFVLGHSSTGVLPANQFSIVPRGKDYEPDDAGDWGLMAKWAPEWLDGSLGAYYRNTSDILPQSYLGGSTVSAGNVNVALPICKFIGVPTCVKAQAGGNLVNSLADTEYGLAYAEDIDIFGISLSKNIEGVSVGSDLNYRHNMPLASITAIFSPELANDLYANLYSGAIPLGSTLALPARGAGTGVVDQREIDNSTFATGDTLHWVVNGLTTFADTPVFDSATLLGEVYTSYLVSLDDDNSALYKGKSTYHGIDASDRSNVGIAVNFTPTWYQVFPGVDMTAPLSVNVGVDGTSPVQGGGAKDTGNYAVGVGAQIYNKYFVDLKYVDAFGKTEDCDYSPDTVNGPTDTSGDGATPNALATSQAYTCYEGSYSSFSGAGATIEDRGAVYLTFKTTI
ncbi:DUF1302 domain-containing protein [Pseudomonas sp. N040]|uniref:DUF1302 domain-containing protein n=1 Tax=Pseudomonas sp. N040 TaxID=2785325 RepID=UPI0018A2DAE2|nr:DUF1302 family protein [Pseudomonas sp. N040]MBF7729758.1 DUF1302 domain-containing protein [Pseudomonas sp. N040]MBW7013400.1 DUF1302 domain-containing protein [Pseudomonas sp. N040]